ncbi:hypothetical protein MUG91_G21n49 [Manis pentadactyla]|nr:hypothetical protein MUG91_G21n49 [Manis pentadactyla]
MKFIKSGWQGINGFNSHAKDKENYILEDSISNKQPLTYEKKKLKVVPECDSKYEDKNNNKQNMNKPKQIIEKKYSKISKNQLFYQVQTGVLEVQRRTREPLYTERSNKS